MADASDNGRITMAVLGTKVDEVLKRLDKLAECVERDHDRIVLHGQILEDRGRRITTLEGQQVARTWETRIVEIALAIAAGLGLLRGA